MPGIDVRMMTYGERVPTQDRYNSEESLEDNQSTTSSTESRQSDFQKKEHEFIPTRSSGIMASKPAANPAQFTRINSNPLLISAQKQMLLVEEVKKKKEEVKVGEDIPDWQSNLDGWKLRRRKQSEDAIVRVSEMKRVSDQELEHGSRRKSSLGRKISLQIENDDQIDFDDLVEGGEEEEGEEGAGGRRRSRAVSQEKAIPEEEDELEDKDESLECSASPANPYQSAIEGYRTFARAQEKAGEVETQHSQEDRESSVSRSLSTSSLSSTHPPSSLSSSFQRREKEEEWQEALETVVQPARRVSTEVSLAMRQKMASFTQSQSNSTTSSKEVTPVRTIQSDNKFQDKLKAFKTIETAASSLEQMPPMSRRESEPALSRSRAIPAYKSSSSSSFMNTIQNAKFFQQNSLGSEEAEDSGALEDALEESFNVLEDGKDEQKEHTVFSADDFIPTAGKMAPPQEKPPPLPAAPPPTVSEEETEIDKQEREIIESLEREEKEQKKMLEMSSSVLKSQSTQSTSLWSGQEAESRVSRQSSDCGLTARRKEKESRDYSKHWLIQEAEQRRIAEAKQKANLNLQQNSEVKMENIANNNTEVGVGGGQGDTDNIYANVDAANLNFNKNHSPYLPRILEPGAQIPGPQVPPRLGEAGVPGAGQDRVLSVSGKKKCSHCKDELGRGAAMIIESLRLFYHIRCFKCCVCSIQLGNGEQGTDVRVRNNRLHCQNCYSNDEGLKFSKV